MSLRPKIILILVAVVVGYAAMDFALQRLLVMQSFEQVEQEFVGRDLERTLATVRGEIADIDERCVEWATWDDAWNFVQDPDEQFVTSNLGDDWNVRHGLDLVFLCDTQGRVVWGDIRDRESGESISMREFPREQLSSSHRMMQHEDATTGIAGVMITGRGPMIVSSRPILRTSGEGPVAGVVLFGRLLDDILLDELGERVGAQFRVWPLEGVLPDKERAILDEVTSSFSPVVRVQQDTIDVYGTLDDLREVPAMLVRASVERRVSASGARAVRYALISTMAAGLLILLAFLILIQRTVLGPIERLTGHAVHIGQTEDFTRRLEVDRPDEIGILSREFDQMIEKLEQSRAAVVKTARLAGMSEIATGVLHNVGNVLNSVNVSATMMHGKVQGSSVKDLARLKEVLDANADDLAGFVTTHPQGKHLRAFLGQLADQMVTENREMAFELQSLLEGVEHMKALVNSQQSYATRAEVSEMTDIGGEIEGALSISERSGSGPDDIDVVLEFDELPAQRLDKHKLMEILVNLIQNARQALEGVDSPRLTVRLSMPEPDRVRIEIADNGVGTPEENLVKIFNHGFTTKPSGHGFGLHSSANAATEMGGKLFAESDGPGEGATFVLEVPIREVRAAA